MSRRYLVAASLAALLCLPTSLVSRPAAQEDAPPDRVQQLEDRVARLEEILFATTKLSVYDAQRHLSDAEFRLKESEKLFFRGLLDEYQLQWDRFEVERARLEVRLAESDGDARLIAAHIDLRQAENELVVAQRRLEFAERNANYPRGSLSEIDLRNAEVERAKIRLLEAQGRLKAIQK
jgi:hypothetical protein